MVREYKGLYVGQEVWYSDAGRIYIIEEFGQFSNGDVKICGKTEINYYGSCRTEQLKPVFQLIEDGPITYR